MPDDTIDVFAERKLRAPFKCEPFVEMTYLDAIDKACFIQAKHTGEDKEALNARVLRALAWAIKVHKED